MEIPQGQVNERLDAIADRIWEEILPILQQYDLEESTYLRGALQETVNEQREGAVVAEILTARKV